MRVFSSGSSIFVATPQRLCCYNLDRSSCQILPLHKSSLIDATPLVGDRITAVYDDKSLVIFARSDAGWAYQGDGYTCLKKPSGLVTLDNGVVVVGDKSGDVLGYSSDVVGSRAILTHTSSMISSLATSSDGALLFSGDCDGRIKITRVADQRLHAICLGLTASEVTALCDAGPGRLLSASANGTLSLWCTSSGTLMDSKLRSDDPSTSSISTTSTTTTGSASDSTAAIGKVTSFVTSSRSAWFRGASDATGTAQATKLGPILAAVGIDACGNRLIACAFAGTSLIQIFSVLSSATASGTSLARDSLLSCVAEARISGKVCAMAIAPKNLAHTLSSSVGAEDPRLLETRVAVGPAVLLVLETTSGEAYRVNAFDVTATTLAGTSPTIVCLSDTDENGGTAMARALAAVAW